VGAIDLIFKVVLITTLMVLLFTNLACASFIAIYDNSQVGTWVVETVGSSAGAEVIGFGWSGAEPIVGDWDVDGSKEVGVYNRAGNNFLIRYPDSSYEVIGLGWSGVTPVVGDFDGDGNEDVGVYDNKGTWAFDISTCVRIVGFGCFLVPQGNNFRVIGLGWPGVIPIVGNWDSNPNDEVGVYDPQTSAFALEGQNPFVFGKPGSQPIIGDVDSDGITEIGVCNPDGTIVYNSAEQYSIEVQKWRGSTLIGA